MFECYKEKEERKVNSCYCQNIETPVLNQYKHIAYVGMLLGLIPRREEHSNITEVHSDSVDPLSWANLKQAVVR